MTVNRIIAGLLVGAGSAALLLGGCASNPAKDRPFSPEWTQQIENERAFEERKRRIREGHILGITRDRAPGVDMDERGRPGMKVGGDTGLRASTRGTSGANVGYGYEWDFVRPQR